MGGNNDGKILVGQNYYPEKGFVSSYTQQVRDNRDAATLIGDARTEITPMDGASSRVKVWAVPTAALATLYRSSTVYVNVSFPPILRGVTVTYNLNSGDGEGRTVSQDAYSIGTSGGLSYSPNSSGRSSAAVLPDVVPDILELDGQNAVGTQVAFFLPDNSSMNAVLSRLTSILGATVSAWPRFQAVSRSFVVKGQEKSISINLAADHRDQWSASGNLSYAVSTQKEHNVTVGVTNKVVRLPACVHGDITILNTSQTISASLFVEVKLPQIFGFGAGPSFAPLTLSSNVVPVTVTGSVFPTSLPSTGTIPTSGLYLYGLNTQPDVFERQLVGYP